MRTAPVFSSRHLDRLGDRLTADVDSGAIAGADLLVGGADGAIWRRTVGYRDRVAHAPLGPDALWRIYSMTKVVVSAAAMVLAERGALRLDQPVAAFIPAFEHLSVLDPDGGLRPARARPTVQDLLRHTAGIAYGYLGDGPARRTRSDLRPGPKSPPSPYPRAVLRAVPPPSGRRWCARSCSPA